jgi:glycosyltransferase involved in cell wall biosynthesis
MKIAFVYDRINKWGGVESLLLALHQIWPDAPFYASVYDSQTASWADDLEVKTSWLQNWPLARTHHELYPWLTPIAFETFDFSGFDVVVSITSAEAKGILTKPETLHVCYCLTPTRYLWSHHCQYVDQPGLGVWSKLAQTGLGLFKKPLQRWDLTASFRPDHYLAISKTVQARIKKYYQQDSEIVYPGIDIKRFKNSNSYTLNPKPYFLIVSRLVSYKNIDLAIKAANQMDLNLKIIGTGKDEVRLKSLAGPTIEFLGFVSQDKLASYYQQAQALIMPGEEDFGLTSLEAQALGTPIIALKKGGATETVVSEKTGLFFDQPKVSNLKSALEKFSQMSFSKRACIKNANKYNIDTFKYKFKKKVEALWQQQRR